nr:hypothetical protein [Tanacetum cinerariifolium]
MGIHSYRGNKRRDSSKTIATIRYSREIRAKGTVKKSFLPPRWRLLMAQIIQCLGGKTGGHDQIINKDAIILYCLANRVEVDFARLPELKELPSKITELSGEVKELKKNVQEMEIELPEDLKDIPNKLVTFTSIVSREFIKEDKGKEVMSSKDTKEEETESDSEDDYANPANSMVETSKQKNMKKFSFVTKCGEQFHLTAKKIEEQKRIE